MRKTLLAIAAATLAVTTATPAAADPPPWAPAHGKRAKQQQQYRSAMYDNYGRYAQPRALSARDTVWRGNDGQYYCRRDNGTTGLIVGGAAGALLGRTLISGQQRTLATILGGAAGALLGRELDRGGIQCR